MEERKVNVTQKFKSDKALALLIPGTEILGPIIKLKLPPKGGELFETLPATSTEIFRLVTNSGRNVVYMATPITLLTEHGECNVDKLRILGIEAKDIGGQYVLDTNCIEDTKADISCTTNEVREARGRAPITYANGGVTGVGGVHK